MGFLIQMLARDRSPFQGGRQSEERTMQEDDTLIARSLDYARHPPGSQARPSSLKGGPKEVQSDLSSVLCRPIRDYAPTGTDSNTREPWLTHN